MRAWLDAIRSAIPAKDVRAILDVGCGTGRFAAALADAFGPGYAGAAVSVLSVTALTLVVSPKHFVTEPLPRRARGEIRIQLFGKRLT